MPYSTEVLRYSPRTGAYSPQNDHFEGYFQFSNPRTLPYYTQEKKLKSNRQERQFVEQVRNSMKLISD